MSQTKEERKAELKTWFTEFMDEYESKGFLKCPNCDILFKIDKYGECPKCGAKWDPKSKSWIMSKPQESEKPEESENGEEGSEKDDNWPY